MTKKTDKDLVRKIWLAGIGAYGRGVTEVKGTIDEVRGKGSAVFDELVNKGEMIETVGKYKAEELLGKGKRAVEDMTPDLEIDERIARMRARLSGVPETDESRLATRVDRLEAKLDAILEKLEIGSSQTKKAAAKKPTTKKMTTEKTKPATKPTKKA